MPTDNAYGHLYYDFRGKPSLESLKRALNPLGIHVYEDPEIISTDQYGFIFSKEPLTVEELDKVSKTFWPE